MDSKLKSRIKFFIVLDVNSKSKASETKATSNTQLHLFKRFGTPRSIGKSFLPLFGLGVLTKFVKIVYISEVRLN